MRRRLMFVTVLMFLNAAATTNAQDAVVSRWEKDIQTFESQIADGTSQPGGVVFVGSSSIRKWDLPRWFPEHRPINLGFGGSEVADSVQFFERIITPLQPSMVLLYAGDNDIAKGKTAEIVHRDFNRFVQKFKQQLPATSRLGFIAIKPSTSRWKLAPEMAKANQLIAATCAQDKQLEFIDIWKPMLTTDGPPPDSWFVKDGLHLSDAGYELWTGIVKPYLPPAK